MSGSLMPPVVFELAANIKDFQAKMRVAEGELDKLEKSGATSGQKFAAGLKAGTLAATAALSAAIGYAAKEAMENEEAMAMLNASIKALGENTSTVIPQVENMAESMGNLGFDDEEATAAFTSLNTAMKDSNEALGRMGLVADLARAKHIPMTEAAKMLAAATQGSGRAFREFGVVMDTSIKDKAERGKKAMNELADVLKGRASAYANTLKGQMDVLKETMNNTAEDVGSALLPTIKNLAKAFQVGARWMKEHSDVMTKVLVGAIGLVTAAYVKMAIANIIASWELWLTAAAIAAVVAGFVWLWNNIEGFAEGVVGIVDYLGSGFIYLFAHLTWLLSGVVFLIDRLLGAMSAVASAAGNSELASNLDGWGNSVRGAAEGMEDFANSTWKVGEAFEQGKLTEGWEATQFNFDMTAAVDSLAADFSEAVKVDTSLTDAGEQVGKKVGKGFTKAIKDRVANIALYVEQFKGKQQDVSGDINRMLALADAAKKQAAAFVKAAQADVQKAKGTNNYAAAVKELTAATKLQTAANKYANDVMAQAQQQAQQTARAIDAMTDSYSRNQSFLASQSRVSGFAQADTYVEVPVIIDGQVLFRATQRASLLNNRRNVSNGLAVSGGVI